MRVAGRATAKRCRWKAGRTKQWKASPARSNIILRLPCSVLIQLTWPTCMRGWKKRKTARFITHSIPEAVLLADRVVVMSPRPGRIVEIIDIDLPRPRRLDKMPELFSQYTGRSRDIFKASGVLAMD